MMDGTVREDLNEETVANDHIRAYGIDTVLLLTGSVAELPLKYFERNHTDIDVMVVSSGIVAVEKFESFKKGDKEEQLLIEDTEPGYARLVSRDGRIYSSRLDFEGEKDEVEGPSVKRYLMKFSNKRVSELNKIIRTKMLKSIPNVENFSVDRVISVFVLKWPEVANEWITRKRSNGWPSVRTIEKVESQGCHFVPKPDMDRQWRYSFSQAELTLILTWSSTQKYIYHILRLILKEVKDKFKEEFKERARKTVFCSHSLKTLMLGRCENESSAFWLEENFEIAINSILDEFMISLKQMKLQNYFIRNYNNWSKLPVGVGFEKEIEFFEIYSK